MKRLVSWFITHTKLANSTIYRIHNGLDWYWLILLGGTPWNTREPVNCCVSNQIWEKTPYFIILPMTHLFWRIWLFHSQNTTLMLLHTVPLYAFSHEHAQITLQSHLCPRRCPREGPLCSGHHILKGAKYPHITEDKPTLANAKFNCI